MLPKSLAPEASTFREWLPNLGIVDECKEVDRGEPCHSAARSPLGHGQNWIARVEVWGLVGNDRGQQLQLKVANVSNR